MRGHDGLDGEECGRNRIRRRKGLMWIAKKVRDKCWAPPHNVARYGATPLFTTLSIVMTVVMQWWSLNGYV